MQICLILIKWGCLQKARVQNVKIWPSYELFFAPRLSWKKLMSLVQDNKSYNKMVQMLECKSVRSKMGCHWKDWVCQSATRVENARDKAKDHGLRSADDTFYIDDEIPDDSFIYGDPKLYVYSTSYADTWNG